MSLNSAQKLQSERVHESDKDLPCNATYYTQKSVTIKNDSDINNILITDNINGASEFSTSRRILQEIHLFFPSVKIDFAYSLAKGGVAVHTTCKKNKELLLAGLPAESFGGGVKHRPKGYRNHIVVVKGVDTAVAVSYQNSCRKKVLALLTLEDLPEEILVILCKW